jgi:hypothetical protein
MSEAGDARMVFSGRGKFDVGARDLYLSGMRRMDATGSCCPCESDSNGVRGTLSQAQI